MGSADKIRDRVILFDGVCNLCNSSVNFIIDHDPKGYFKFAPLQSRFAQNYLSEMSAVPDSIVLLDQGTVFIKSDAALRIAKDLKFPFSILYYFIFFPRVLRDFMYDFIARNRYHWFGKQDTCRMPTPELKERFIESPILS